jgi:hypothetical protein
MTQRSPFNLAHTKAAILRDISFQSVAYKIHSVSQLWNNSGMNTQL